MSRLSRIARAVLIIGLKTGICSICFAESAPNIQWLIDDTGTWQQIAAQTANMTFKDGHAHPSDQQAAFSSVIKTFDKSRKLKSITFNQSTVWDNWTQIEDITPPGLGNAYVFLPVAPGDYYIFATYKQRIPFPKGLDNIEKRAFKKKWLKENSKKNPKVQSGGYHVWHSKDLKSWTHGGQVTHSNWMTTAEYADGKFYLYYDKPNDQDPHLIIDEDIMDGKVGKDYGMVLKDPTHGSDCAIFRDEDGIFHIIYEDWSPIDAKANAWDSPLAAHASSPDGINGFESHEHPYPVDHRTKPTGKKGTYIHRASGTEPLEYEIHEPAQDAYGDWTMIKVGKQYYLFCDYDPADHEKSMRMGRFTSDDIYGEFKWAGEIGAGFHPDPSIGFAEGKFYAVMQRETDFVSPGPWVDGVTARAGVDTDGDGKVDQWTKWQKIKEIYSQKPGFARIVDVKPATLNIGDLPAGKGFQFEFRTQVLKNGVQPIMDKVSLIFE